MMLWFWIILTLMIVLACSFIVLPLIGIRKKFLISHDEINAKLYKTQLLSLENELENNTITPQIYRQLTDELKRGLLRDIKNTPEKSRNEVIKPSFFTAAILLIFIVSCSTILYFKWGDSKQLHQYYSAKSHAAEINDEIKNFKSPEQLINKMLAVLQQHPHSAQGWFLLGRLYSGTGKFLNAEQAFSKAIAYNPNKLNYKLEYAQADFFANNKSLSKQATLYLNQVISKEPKNLSAINLIALNAFSHKNYQVAIDQWEALLNYFPANSTDGQVIMNAIVEAQKRLEKQSVINDSNPRIQ